MKTYSNKYVHGREKPNPRFVIKHDKHMSIVGIQFKRLFPVR